MSAMHRNKGKTGEREAAELVRQFTGWDVRRRVRQHAGDSDLQGVPGWAVEVKRHRTATPGDVARWWAQTVTQAGNLLPVLLYRADRGEWRAVWPLAVCLVHQSADTWRGVEWTADTTVQAWAAVARECVVSSASENKPGDAPTTENKPPNSTNPTTADWRQRVNRAGSGGVGGVGGFVSDYGRADVEVI
jgi:hypothetical protein